MGHVASVVRILLIGDIIRGYFYFLYKKYSFYFKALGQFIITNQSHGTSIDHSFILKHENKRCL